MRAVVTILCLLMAAPALATSHGDGPRKVKTIRIGPDGKPIKDSTDAAEDAPRKVNPIRIGPDGKPVLDGTNTAPKSRNQSKPIANYVGVLIVAVFALIAFLGFFARARCSRCRAIFVMKTTGNKRPIGHPTEQEWECEECGYKEWRKYSPGGFGNGGNGGGNGG